MANVAKDKSQPKKEDKKPKKSAPKKSTPKKAQATAASPKRGRPSSLDKLHRAVALFKQVSDPTRIQVMMMLRGGGKSVGEISAVVSQSQPTTSHHLSLLRHSGLISPTRKGKNNIYDLTNEGEALIGAVANIVG